MVPSLKELSYGDRTAKLNLPSLYYRRARGGMIEAYEHFKVKYSVDTPYTKLEDTGSRGHELKLKKERAAKAVSLNSFSFRINNTWNRLPSYVMDPPSINSFKARQDMQTLDSVLVYSQDSVHQKFSFTGSLFERPKLRTGC